MNILFGKSLVQFCIRYILICSPLLAFKSDDGKQVDRYEAKRAFDLLCDIRNHPDKYYSKMDFLKNEKISDVQLVWNDTLAKAAEWKVLDMIKNKYSAHVDPKGNGMNFYINKFGYKIKKESLKNNKSNYFESICFGAEDGEEGIINLIIDKGVPSLGHRKHLLGTDKDKAKFKDIGIAFAKGSEKSKWTSYMCVLIASHDY